MGGRGIHKNKIRRNVFYEWMIYSKILFHLPLVAKWTIFFCIALETLELVLPQWVSKTSECPYKFIK